MFFAPQRRALFRHLYFQKWSGPGVFCTFWLWNAPQRRALFRHLNFQKWSEHVVLLCAFNMLTSKVLCATTCHNGVQFFISHLPSGLGTRRFSEPTFRRSGATNHWKNIVFRDFSYLFADLDRLSSETLSFFFSSLLWLSSLTLPISAFHLSIVGSLTSKLPSIIIYVKSIYLSIYPSIISKYISNISVYRSIYPSIYRSIYLISFGDASIYTV